MRRFSQRHNIGRTIIARRGAAPLSVLALCCIAQHAHAVTFTVDDFQISLETTLSAGVSFRTSGQNPYFLSPANGGTYSGYQGPSDLNWPAGHPFQAPLRGTNDLQIDRDNYTAFFRATYLIDPILSNPNSSNYQPLSHQAVYTVGQNFRLLDGFVRGKYDWFGQSEAVSVGWQTYNWGEGLFLRNGLNAVNPIDAAGIHAAGADLRSLYFPLPSISLRTSLPDGFSLEAFYEFQWAKTQLDPYGTFFSTDVAVTPGATKIGLPPAITQLGLGAAIPRIDDRKADDQGEFGIALRKSVEALDDGEVGLYFENFGARYPVASFITGSKLIPHGQTYADTTAYYAEYPNHVQYIGTSLSTSGPWGSALAGEVSISPNTPLQLNPLPLIAQVLAPGLAPTLERLCHLGFKAACSKLNALVGTSFIAQDGLPGYDQVIDGYERFAITHIRLNATKAFSGISGTPVQSWSLAMEYGADIVNNFPSQSNAPFYRPLSVNALNPGDANFFTKGLVDTTAAPTQVSEGVVGRAAFNMPALIAGRVDVNASVAVEYDFQGTTPSPLVTFDEHLMTATFGLNFSYLQRWQANIAYTSHFGVGGSAISSVNLDRDYISMSTSYRF